MKILNDKDIELLNNIELLEMFVRVENRISYGITEEGIIHDDFCNYSKKLKKEILRRMNEH